MKTIISIVIVINLLSISLQSSLAQNNQSNENNNSLLWEINGNSLKSPSYLFGTIHIMDSLFFFLEDIVIKRFCLCEKIVFEIDMDEPGFQQETFSAAMMKNDSLENILSVEEYERVNQFFKTEFNFPLDAIKKMKPFYVGSLIDALSLPQSAKSYEQEFVVLANQQDKEILGISTIEKESEILNGIILDVQIKLLFDAIDEYYGGFERKHRVLMAYQDQDIDKIFSIIKSATIAYDNLFEAMFPRRHEVWIPNIISLMKEQSCFFAVGVGHLAGEEGVIELLRHEGYVVSAISGEK